MAIGARQRRIWLALAAAMAAAATGGVLIGLLLKKHVSPIVAGVAAAVVLAGVLLANLPYWRRLDHMQRDGLLLSWFWGGSFGGGMGVLLALILGGPHRPLVAGAALVWLLQVAGYLAARLWWWLAHRAQGA